MYIYIYTYIYIYRERERQTNKNYTVYRTFGNLKISSKHINIIERPFCETRFHFCGSSPAKLGVEVPLAHRRNRTSASSHTNRIEGYHKMDGLLLENPIEMDDFWEYPHDLGILRMDNPPMNLEKKNTEKSPGRFWPLPSGKGVRFHLGLTSAFCEKEIERQTVKWMEMAHL